MTFGFQGIQPQINPTIIQKNLTINNGPTGWAGSLFAGMAIGMGLGTGGSIYNPIMPYTPMSGIVPGGCYGPLNPLGLGMGGIASPIANPMAMLNSRMAQPQQVAQHSAPVGRNLQNLVKILPKNTEAIDNGDGTYTVRKENGKYVTGEFQEILDSFSADAQAKIDSAASKDKAKDDKTEQA